MMARTLMLILVCTVVVPGLRAYELTAYDAGRLQRDFSENLAMLAIENWDGPSEVQTWNRPEARVVASASRIDSRALMSQVLFDRAAPDGLSVRIRREAATAPIALVVYVPSSIHVTLRAGSGSVSVTGMVAGLSVETESGAITLNLPVEANSDLSLRTIEGSIDSKVAATTFGKPDRNSLDARIGRGGSTVIARSMRGNIFVLPDTLSRNLVADVRSDPIGASYSAAATTPLSKAISEGVSEPRPSTSDDVAVSADAIKLEARLVSLNVKVTDATGKTLPALHKEDFVIYEDSIPQDVFHFEQVNAPLKIVLLLDLSGSTSHKMKIIKKAAQNFVDSLNPGDNIAVAAFSSRFFVISNFTTNHKQLKDRIDDIKNRHSGTAYYDAMWATLNLLDEAGGSRKAVVVMTDGVDNSLDHPDDSDYHPKHGFEALLARVEEADATIYPIYLDTEYETIGRNGRSGHDA
jgi:hypothetical protein